MVRVTRLGELAIAIYEYVGEHPGCTSADVAAAFGCERDRAKNILDDLFRVGKVGRQAPLLGHRSGYTYYPEIIDAEE